MRSVSRSESVGNFRTMKVDRKTTALLIIDVINDFEFIGADKLFKYALPAAKKIAALRKRLQKTGIPVIYVNDNFGRWQSSFHDQIQRCISPDCPGREVASLLLPNDEDYFVLKPKHSGFYASPLPVLLEALGRTQLILTGLAGDICVLYTANDAYMRNFELIIPADCVASETLGGNNAALKHMETRLKAKVMQSKSIL